MVALMGFRSFIQPHLAQKPSQERLCLERGGRKILSCWAAVLACVLLVLVYEPAISAQSGGSPEWTWMGGANTVNQAGVYGTLGALSAGNVPGARYCANSWTDGSGNAWIFGGIGVDGTGSEGTLNDLWKFNPTTRQWAWMGGSAKVAGAGFGVYGTLEAASKGNLPGGRFCAASWTDTSGNLWLFGGEGYDSTGTEDLLNDLWRFNPSNLEWTWMGGSDSAEESDSAKSVYGTPGIPDAGNIPGGRGGANSWTDLSGNLWLFGGGGTDSTNTLGELNDLWKFDLSTHEWTWVCGSQTVPSPSNGQPGVYGTMGEPAPGNTPGGRQQAASWTDASGNLWLFGGGGADSTGTHGQLNDLWQFNPSMGQWTWMSGSSTVQSQGLGQSGVYGTLGVPGAENAPGGRSWARSWTDLSGNLWLFGGMGYDFAGTYGSLNDLWEFNTSTREWTWMDGSNLASGQPGMYGTLGASNAGNFPGGRYGAASWTDANGNFHLFGGMGYDAEGNFSELGDLWTQIKKASLPQFSLPAGPYTGAQSVTITDATSGVTLYYTANGATPTASSTKYTGAIQVSATETVQAIAVASGYTTSGVASVAYTINAAKVASTPTFTPAGGTYTSAQSAIIADATAGATIYYTLDGSTPSASSLLYKSPVSVSQTTTVTAIAIGAGYTASPVVAATYTIKLASDTPLVHATYSMSATAVTATPGESGSSILTVISTDGYAGTVTLNCAVTSIPASASVLPTCSSSQTVTLSSVATSATTTVTVDTAASAQAATALPRPRTGWVGTSGGAVLALLFFLWGPASRRKWQSMLAVLLVLAAVGGLAGCSSVNSNVIATGVKSTPATTPGVYTITLTGTGNDPAKTTATTALTLTVN